MTDVCSFVPEEQEIDKNKKFEPAKYKTYKYQWIILGLFFLVSLSSAFQWPMYVIVDNVIEEYYGVSLETVNFTATVFLLCYVICIYPATYLLQKFGLRFAVIVAATGPCIASLIKLLSVHPNRFWVVLLAQTIDGITQTYVTLLPASVAAAWFGASQVSTACSIASAGMQLALATGCLVPTLLLSGEPQKQFTEIMLGRLTMGVATFSTIVLLLIILFFKLEPPTPPSETQQKIKHVKNDLLTSIRQIIRSLPFVLFWFGYSCHVGILYAMCFLINPTIIKYYPKNASDVGAIGLLFIGVGVIGAALFGIILDKFRRFKETTIVVTSLTSISFILFTLTLNQGIAYIYVFQTLTGFFMTAIFSVGLEVGAEITYPLPESISSGFLLSGSKILGFIFTTLFTYLFSQNVGIWVHVAMAGVVVLSTVLIPFISFDLKRQAVHLGLNNVNTSNKSHFVNVR